MKNKRILFFVIFLGLNTGILFANQCEGNNEAVPESGKHYKLGPDEIIMIKRNDPDVLVHQGFPARYLRVFIEPVEIDESGWSLVLRDRDGHLLQTFGPKDFPTITLTKHSLENLKEEGISDEVWEGLQLLKEKKYTHEKEFLKAVEEQIGTEQIIRHKELILKHATSNKLLTRPLRRIINDPEEKDPNKKPDRSIGKVYFSLVFTDPEANATFVVQEYIAMPEPIKYTFHSVQDKNNIGWKSLYSSDVSGLMHCLGDTVGYLSITDRNHDWGCSGVVIATEPVVLLLTNFHCGWAPATSEEPTTLFNFWHPQTCNDMWIDLSWDEDVQSREYRCREVIVHNRQLDIAVLRIEAEGTDNPPIPPIIRQKAVTITDKISIIHHPAGAPKKISTKEIASKCRVVDTEFPGWISTSPPDVRFTHQCDTESSSSGAPVFNQDGYLIGLHNQGFSTTDPPDKLNKAIRMDKILNDPKFKQEIEDLGVQLQVQ